MEFSFAILSRLPLFVKSFFENFSSSILKPLRFQRFVSDSFARLPRLSSFVKPFFRKLFSFRLLLLDARLSQPDSFARLPSPPSFVNPFLSPFFPFSVFTILFPIFGYYLWFFLTTSRAGLP